MTREEILAMTDEEKRIKAAELMGWRRVHVATEGCLSGSLVGTPQRWLTDVDMEVPDCLNDIAAAWELREYAKSQRKLDDLYWAHASLEEETSAVELFHALSPRAITTAFILAMEGE